MKKQIAIICLFLFCIAGVKAQTYCYHFYKEYDQYDIPELHDSYLYITFKGDLIYYSKKDGSYLNDFEGKPFETLYKFYGYNDDVLVYKLWQQVHYIAGKRLVDTGFKDLKILLVSKDKTIINEVYKGAAPEYRKYGKSVEPWTKCYERCPFDECEKPHVPTMKE